MAEIVERIPVLASGDVYPGRCACPHQRKTVDVVGADWLLEPGDVVFGNALGQVQGLFCRERTIGIDEKASDADRVAGYSDPLRVANRVAADFHFDPATAVVPHPATKLFAQPRVGVAGEPAAAVDRDGVAAAAE